MDTLTFCCCCAPFIYLYSLGASIQALLVRRAERQRARREKQMLSTTLVAGMINTGQDAAAAGSWHDQDADLPRYRLIADPSEEGHFGKASVTGIQRTPSSGGQLAPQLKLLVGRRCHTPDQVFQSHQEPMFDVADEPQDLERTAGQLRLLHGRRCRTPDGGIQRTSSSGNTFNHA